MAQTIRYMSKAVGVTPAADDAAATLQPLQGSVAALTHQGAGVPINSISDITLATATDPLATSDMYVAGCVPKGHKLIDSYIVAGDIDSGVALVMSAGLLKKDFTDLEGSSTNVITTSSVGQAGGVARADTAAGLLQAVSDYDTWYGIKITTGATGLNTGAKLRMVLIYIPDGN
jgi:hypothetical protein